MSTPVLGGMLAASVFGIFIIPLLYVIAQHLREGTQVRRDKYGAF